MTTHRDHRPMRAVVLTVVGVTALGLAAAPASAKSSLSFSAGPRSVKAGGHVRAAGKASDDNSSFNRVCVQERQAGGAWHTVKCSKAVRRAGGAVNVNVPARHRGQLQLRAVLLEGRTPQDQHAKVRSVSRVVAVTVR
ncbi:hypothetical protein [Streptomyces sp. GS7]|uniref:hypothetical protein n=1 Tax=Streptomyces sp. GS7 TaxID=2692234 RepID=UPI00131673D6|nr:hypothetical protein [Streptomyces sp. GS7]QHC23149.1 hypothetical protein GR130_18755 [Streptomyces sp. GS7]